MHALRYGGIPKRERTTGTYGYEPTPPNPRQELLLELDFRFTRRHGEKKSRKKTKQTPTINDQTKNK